MGGKVVALAGIKRPHGFLISGALPTKAVARR
jgi:hypothetical protein